MANIQHLAPELLTIILSEVDSPIDLLALVSASSACFRTYSAYRRPILLRVLCNGLSPQLLRELLAITNIPRPGRGNMIPIDCLKTFVDHYFSTEPFELPLDTVNTSIIDPVFLRTYKAVNRLTEMYFFWASGPLMRSSKKKEEDEEEPKFIALSATENDRIQRAFYRYELFSQLFPAGRPGKGWRPNKHHGQPKVFINRMTPWEAEELSCIHLFLATIVGAFVDDMEDEVFDAVISCPDARGDLTRETEPSLLRDSSVRTIGPRRVALPSTSSFPAVGKRKPSPSSSPTTTETSSKCQTSHDMETDTTPKDHRKFTSDVLYRYRLQMFNKEFAHLHKPQIINKLVSRGLDYILRLIDAPSPSHRRSLIQTENMKRGRYFLPEVLYQLQDRYTPSPAPVGIDIRDGPRPEDQRLPMFCFRNRDRGLPTPYFRIYNNAFDIEWNSLRGIGYLFWDKERLAGPKPQSTLLISWNMTKSCSNANSRFYRVFSGRKSVEERLEGISIPVGEMERISREFGIFQSQKDKELNRNEEECLVR